MVPSYEGTKMVPWYEGTKPVLLYKETNSKQRTARLGTKIFFGFTMYVTRVLKKTRKNQHLWISAPIYCLPKMR